MDPLTIGFALAQGAGSYVSGAAQRRSAKADRRIAEANYAAENAWNKKENRRVNKANEALGKKLLQVKEVTTETTKGTVKQEQTGFRTGKSSSANSVDIAAMMKAAEDSGINPITFIRNGGMAAYTRTDNDSREDWGQTDTTTTDMTSTTTRTGHNAAAAYQMRMQQPFFVGSAPTVHVPGAGESVGAGIKATASALNDAHVRDTAQDFQRELLDRQLEAVQYGTPMSRSFYVPGFSTSGGTTVTPKTQGGLSSQLTIPEPGDRTATNPFPVQTGFRVDPNSPDAEQAETRYGDIMQEVFGAYNLGNDLVYNASGRNIPTLVNDAYNNGFRLPKAKPGERTVRDALRDLGSYIGGLKPPASPWGF
jgi:hypothetical protein